MHLKLRIKFQEKLKKVKNALLGLKQRNKARRDNLLRDSLREEVATVDGRSGGGGG